MQKTFKICIDMAQSNVNKSKLKRSFQMLAAKIPQRTIRRYCQFFEFYSVIH